MNLSVSLSREQRLLLACVKLAPASEDIDRIIQQISDPAVNWDRVIEYAFQQDVAPLIYNTLRRLNHSMPGWQSVLDSLRTAYYANAARNAVIFRELTEILQTLRQRRRSVIVLKGAALAETVYPNRALRPMSDLDLLVRKEELDEVEGLLAAVGYSCECSSQKIVCTHHYHLGFRKRLSPAMTVSCELHWQLERPTRPFSIDINGVWDRARLTTVADVQTLTLSPEDTGPASLLARLQT